jgi:hypothetical protein
MFGNTVLALAGLTLVSLAACADPPLPVSVEDGASVEIVFGSAAGDRGATSTSISLHAIRSNECNGEQVELSGVIHLVSHSLPDGSVLGHFNYQNVTGIGLSTGIQYRVSAVDQVRLEAPFPSSIQSVRHLRLLAQGPGDDVLVDAIFHITVNANGEVTAEMDELTTRCV